MNMNEIWLAMNIAYETALGLLPALTPLVLMWAVMMVINRKKLKRIKPITLAAVAVLVALVAVVALPSMTQSSLADMTYWVDWAALLGMAVGCGVAAALLIWPVLAMRQR
jgi:drug/metabolite transporter (DMT)-like permease